MKDILEIERLIAQTERELAFLDSKRSYLLEKLKDLEAERDSITAISFKAIDIFQEAPITNQSSEAEKISLFRKIFKGREDVYPRRFESRKTGKAGYQPACRNEWVKGVCNKPRIPCSKCDNQDFLPITDEVIRSHLFYPCPFPSEVSLPNMQGACTVCKVLKKEVVYMTTPILNQIISWFFYFVRVSIKSFSPKA